MKRDGEYRLDPTVLPAGADYTRADVAHLFVRRLKKDARAQIRQDFPEREVYKLAADASPFENRPVDCLAELQLTSDGAVRHDGAMLFRITLEKPLFSSPAACVQALIIVPAVGWTSASAVHPIPRRRWWTALRLSSMNC